MERKIYLIFATIGFLLLLGIIYMSANFVGALALGVFIYYCTRPIYRLLVSKDINKNISAIIAQLSFVVPAVLLIAYTIQIVAFEIRSVASEAGGVISELLKGQDLVNQIRQNETIYGIVPVEEELDINQQPQNQSQSITDAIGNIDSGLVSELFNYFFETVTILLSSISGLFFTLFVAFALSFYLQRDGNKIKNMIYEKTEYDKTVVKFGKELDQDLKVVFLGNIALALGASVIGATAFYIITIIFPDGNMLRYPGLIGFLCGIASLIPVVGMKLVYVPVTIILLSISLIQNSFPEALVFPSVFLLVALILVDTIPDLVARPYLGSLGGISTGVLLFSYILGPLSFGWYGLFLGPLVFVSFYEFFSLILPEIIKEYERKG